MTISSTNRKAGPYAGNDSATAFPFAFKVFSASDLYVVRADFTGAETVLALTTDYTVALNPDQNANPGGTINLPAALATGYTLTATSLVDYLQPTDLTNNGGFYPKVITNALDRLTIFCQQLSEQLSRALKYSISSPLGDSALPAPVANNVIGWNSTANGFQNYAPVDNTLLSAALAASSVGGGAALVEFGQYGASFPLTGRSVSNPISQNYVSPTTIHSDTPSVFGLKEGSFTSPNTANNDPVSWVQKFTKYDNGTDRFAHNVGGYLGEVVVKGSGVAGATDTDGTWIGILGNAVQMGVNQGSAAAPDFDAYGNVIGTAGFARATGYPGDGNIACGLWGYAEGPTLDATTLANLPATNWVLAGSEVNIQINHPDIGEQSVLVGKGASVGYLAQNYRTAGTGVKDWTFGMLLGGSPNDGNYSSTDVDNWSGFYTGILIDKIKAKGIRFGQYFKNNSYGIWFPDTYAGSQEPAAAIYLGNSKIAMGQYVGANFANGDLWHNGGNLWFRNGGFSEQIVKSASGLINLPNATNLFRPNGSPNFGVGAVASSTNYIVAFGAAAGAPALAATGASTDIDIEMRPKGAGRLWVGAWTTNVDAAVNGYITVKDSAGTIRKLATIA